MSKDDIYSSPQPLKEFVFDEKVAAVFEDMIGRSVPGYATTISTIGELARQVVPAGGRVYDLGCSLGAALTAMTATAAADVELIGVDLSQAMLSRAAERFADDSRVRLVCADVRDISIENASLVVLNFTLQFIPLESRQALLQRIYDGMQPGGVLLLSEKVVLPGQRMQALTTDLHLAFKRAHGYSDLEIAQKRSALENTLIPECLDDHQQRLTAVGFAEVDVWYQQMVFASMLAIK